MSSASSLLVWGIQSPLPCSYLDPIIPLNYNSREEKKPQQRSGNRNSDRIDRVRARRINARSATRRYPIREEETTKKKRGEKREARGLRAPACVCSCSWIVSPLALLLLDRLSRLLFLDRFSCLLLLDRLSRLLFLDSLFCWIVFPACVCSCSCLL